MRIGILGAGLTGIELGKSLKKREQDFIIFEKDSEVGGLCRTFKSGQWSWDLGVHAIYSKNQEVMNYFHSLPIDYEHIDRNVKVYHHGSDGQIYILDYPFENGLADLPLEDKVNCLLGYVEAQNNGYNSYKNLEDWINNALGYGIARHFMIPYNKKIWNCDLRNISLELINNKIDPTPTRTLVESCLGKRFIGRKYQAKFIYPKKGIGELTRVLSENIKGKIRLNSEVTRIEKGKELKIYCNHSESYEEVDFIVSTMPLVELLKNIKIKGINNQYNELCFNDTFFIMVGLKENRSFNLLRDCHWAFFAGSEIFYRITFMNNLSSQFPPALVAEITYKEGVKEKDINEVKDKIVNDLIKNGIVEFRGDIGMVDARLHKYTYPIPTMGLNKIRIEIIEQLKRYNILLLGRNGAWDYINMDGVIEKTRKFIENNLGIISAIN